MSKKLQLPAFSHLQKTPLLQLAEGSPPALTNTFVWGRWEPISFPESEGDIFHVVQQQDIGRLHNLAYSYYGAARLWWVIAWTNQINNPMTMEVGVTLRIPSPQVVLTTLSGGIVQSGVSLPVNPAVVPIGEANTAFTLIQ